MNILEHIEKQNRVRRAQKNINKLSLPSQTIDFIKKCYQFVVDLGLIKNQYIFSTQFLNSNKYYLGKLLSLNQAPSLTTLSTLVENIKILALLPNSEEFIKKIEALNLEYEKIIQQKLLK